jgi:hypothetical protein
MIPMFEAKISDFPNNTEVDVAEQFDTQSPKERPRASRASPRT